MQHLVRRYVRPIRIAAAAAIALSLLLLTRIVLWGEFFEAVRTGIDSLGAWAPVVFIVVYIATTLVLLPGWWLTLLAGTLFGLMWGMVLSSLASTLAVAVAFLLARHFARRRVERAARNHPHFRALDSAIREGGWRIIALARLSPVLPFGLQNYLYGLTPIGFWTCVITSWAAMLPGIAIYVYLGHLTRAGAAAAVDPQAAGIGGWALRGVGLAATIAMVVYVTRLAQRKLREQTTLENPEPAPEPNDMNAPPSAGKTLALAGVAALMLGTSVYAQFNPAAVRGLATGILGASTAAATEAFEENPAGPTVDHSRFDAVLQRIVTDDAMVDYQRLREDSTDLTAYLDQLAAVDFDALGRNEKLALLINAYNAFTLQLILDHWPVQSIKDIPEAQRWDAERWEIGGRTLSLTEIEHEWLRDKFVEPRIHFAINCASIGCPPLLDEAYVGAQIDEQLEHVTRMVHDNPSRWFQFDPEAGIVKLTKLYDWYGDDFRQVADSPVDFAARYAPRLRRALDAGHRPQIQWLAYDWSLNRKGAPKR